MRNILLRWQLIASKKNNNQIQFKYIHMTQDRHLVTLYAAITNRPWLQRFVLSVDRQVFLQGTLHCTMRWLHLCTLQLSVQIPLPVRLKSVFKNLQTKLKSFLSQSNFANTPVSDLTDCHICLGVLYFDTAQVRKSANYKPSNKWQPKCTRLLSILGPPLLTGLTVPLCSKYQVLGSVTWRVTPILTPNHAQATMRKKRGRRIVDNWRHNS